MRKRVLFSASLMALALSGASSGLAQPSTVIPVRAGVHKTFDRIVFDWPKAVTYKVTQHGTETVVTFDTEASIRFAPQLQDDVTRARKFSVSTQDGHTTVRFTLAPQIKLKSFFNNTAVVIDFQGPLPKAPPKRETEAKPTPKKATQKPEPLTPQSAPTKPVETKELPPPEPPAPAPPVVEAKPTPPPQPQAKLQSQAQISPPIFEPKLDLPPPPDLDLSETPTLVLTLDPKIKTRCVIYSRANVGYVVFDRKMTLSPKTLQNGTQGLVGIDPFDLPQNTAYYFRIPPNATLQATLDGTAWKLFLSKRQYPLAVTTTLVAQPDFALGGRFLLPLPDGPTAIRMTDPVVGDDLILVPLAQSEAFNAKRKMFDFTILPAAQGLVLKPINDNLAVRTVSDGIEITAEGGLLLSSNIDTGAAQQSQLKTKEVLTGKSIFDFATWSGKPGETFTETRQRLQQTIVDVPEAERNRARLELARFYFAKGLGEEAVSLLLFLSREVPDLKFHGDFMALLGAAEILAYRPEEGLRDLTLSGISHQPEVVLWQAVALAQLREWKQASDKFSARQSVLSGYPDPFFSRFFVLAIESALATDRVHEAGDWLHFVVATPHMAAIDPALNFLRGVLAAKTGQAQEAENFWKLARASNDRLYKVRAELSLIDLGVSTRSLTPAQAADRLEALRFAWRGDDLEVDILRRLGQFYIQTKNIKSGINVMSKAVTLYPSSSLAPHIRAEMAKIFRDTFLGPLGKKLTPLDALTLYRQYRDMIPDGQEGNDLMINLAERLVKVDLLDQAAGVLNELAQNRLTGESKNRTLLRLAAIRLLDHKPNEALAALKQVRSDGLTQKMKNERILLQARALSEKNLNAEALALLKSSTSQGAILLQADIAMRDQKWEEAASLLMDLIGSPPPEGVSLSQEQAQWLISATIAYAFADDQAHLDKLAIDYGQGMKEHPQYNAFLILTRPEKVGHLRDLSAAQAQLSQVDVFQNFLDGFRTPLTAPKPDTTQKP